MRFPATPALKPFDLAERPGIGRAASPKTTLSAADFTGVAAQLQPLSLKPGVGRASPATADAKHEELTRTTEQWVAQSFFGTLMKQMRDSPFKSDLFEGGRGGQAFQEMHDQRLVEHMSRGAGRKLVASLVRKIESKSKAAAAYAQQKNNSTEGAQAPRAEGNSMPARSRQAATDEPNPFRNVRVHVAPTL